MKPFSQITSCIAALATASLITGCCGTSKSHTAAYSTPSATTTEAVGSPATTSTVVTGAGDWNLPLYSESLKVGKRETENGNVRLRKIVRTENASEPIELRHDTVVIDREAFEQAQRSTNAAPSDFGAQFQEKEIVIDLRREEAVAEVQPYVAGRIIARKQSQIDRQNVQRQIRVEDVEVVKSGNDQDIQVTERVRTTTSVGAPANSTTVREGSDSSTTDPNAGKTQPTDPNTPKNQ